MSNFEAKAASERKAQEGEEKIMNEIISNIRSDLPKIDVSIKNLLSVILGKSQLDAGSSKVDSISSHYLMDYAKLFLSCLQNTTLLDVMEYCAAFPQVESQSASDRLDEVCRYKAYFAYREHAVSSGQKVSKFFGRGYFIETKVWPRIKSIFLERLESGEFPKLTVGEGRQFLDLYEKSIFQSGSKGSDADLVWSVNFQETLLQRQKERALAAQTRADEAMANALRAELEFAQGGEERTFEEGDGRSSDDENA